MISTDREIEINEFFVVQLVAIEELVGGAIDPDQAVVTITNGDGIVYP